MTHEQFVTDYNPEIFFQTLCSQITYAASYTGAFVIPTLTNASVPVEYQIVYDHLL